MEIYLVRHTSVDVPAGICYGQTDVPLRPTFEEEAEKVKANLDRLAFNNVYTSPLSRCTRLATYCNYPDAIRENRIKELNFGQWEMQPFASLTGEQAQKWFADWINTPTPEGESFHDQYNRVSSFLDELRNQNLPSACLFAHGGVITCARVYAKEYPIEDAFKHIPSYGEIIKITLP